MRTTLCSSLTRCITFAVALLAMAIMAAPASAQTCLQDEFTAAGNHQKLQCTANDVSIAFASNPRSLSGQPQLTCQQGSMFSFVADFHVTTTASARENIGMYFQTAGGPSALAGTCGDNIIAPPHSSSNTSDTVCLGSGTKGAPTGATCTGSGTYESLDASPDNCGDISTGDNNQVITVEVDNALCEAAPGTNQVALPNCTSWQQPGGTIQCVSPPPNWPYPFNGPKGTATAIPGSPSKCNCNDTFTVPIVVQSPSVDVGKACNTLTTTGTPTFDFSTNPATSSPTSCVASSASSEGGTVTYTVSVQNQSNFGPITLDQICDTAYGNIATASGFTPACVAGKVGTPSGTGPTPCSMPQTIAAKSTYTCTFTASQGEDATVNDVATATGVGSNGTTPITGSSSQVTVTSSDAPSAATTTKSLDSIRQLCATARYDVNVQNTSGADETLSLTALSDTAFGSITSVQGNVQGTTCGQPATNTNGGTLSGSAGAGTLSASLAVGSGTGTFYSCQFDAQICGVPSIITTTAGTCSGSGGTCTAGKVGSNCNTNSDCNVTCNGIQHMNSITATLTGDEGETVTNTGGALTVNVCLQ